MTRGRLLACALLLIALGAGTASAGPVELFEYGFNVNGTFAHNSVPAVGGTTINTAGFDFATGLGQITINHNPGTTGANYLIVWLNLDSDSENNTFFNEYATVVGTPAAGLDWEIDEPGYVFGDIFSNVQNGSLDNTNGVPQGSPDDVSIALGWFFNLAPGESALMTLNVTTVQPAGGFYIRQTDPDTPQNIYLSTSFRIDGRPPGETPEPSTVLMLGAGLAACALWRKRWSGRKG